MAITDRKFFDQFDAKEIDKCDARIIWWVDADVIVDFKSLCVKSQDDAARIDNWLFSHNDQVVDIGNNLNGWNLWSLGDVLLRIGRTRSLNDNVSEKILKEICKIREFSDLPLRAAVWRF